MRGICRCHARQHEQIGIRADHRSEDRREIGGVHLVSHIGGDHFKPQRFRCLATAVALAEGIGFVGGDEGNRPDAPILLQVLVDGRTGLVVGDHSKNGVRRRSRVERLWKRVREVDDPVRFRHRAYSGCTVVNVRTHHVVNPFLGHLFHSGNRPFRILLVIERDDLDVIGHVSDRVPAGLVDPGRAGLHRSLVRYSPCGGRPARDSDKADLEDRVLGQGGRSLYDGKRERRRQRREHVSALHISLLGQSWLLPLYGSRDPFLPVFRFRLRDLIHGYEKLSTILIQHVNVIIDKRSLNGLKCLGDG